MNQGEDGEVLSSGDDVEDSGVDVEVPVFWHPLNMRPVPHIFPFMKTHLKRWPNTGVERPLKKLRIRKQKRKRKDMEDLKEGEVTAAHALLNIAIASNVELEQDASHTKQKPVLPQRDVQLTCMQPPRALDVFHQQQMPSSSQMAATQGAPEHHFPPNANSNILPSRKFGPFKLVSPVWRQERMPPPTAICRAHQLLCC